MIYGAGPKAGRPSMVCVPRLIEGVPSEIHPEDGRNGLTFPPLTLI